jgi:phospholipase/carboxylesterase
VILIHGLGDRPRPDWLASANGTDAPLRLIMPQAPTPYHNGFAWFPYRVGDNEPEALGRGIAAAEAQLARAIAVLSERRPTRGRAVVMGFSQGGMLSFALALRHPELVALSLPMSGFLPEPLWPADKPKGKRFPRIAAVHGDADEIVPIEPARRLVAELERLGYPASLREYPGVGHSVTPAMESYAVELLTAYARTGGTQEP